jgi:hypothetical protein
LAIKPARKALMPIPVPVVESLVELLAGLPVAARSWRPSLAGNKARNRAPLALAIKRLH